MALPLWLTFSQACLLGNLTTQLLPFSCVAMGGGALLVLASPQDPGVLLRLPAAVPRARVADFQPVRGDVPEHGVDRLPGAMRRLSRQALSKT